MSNRPRIARFVDAITHSGPGYDTAGSAAEVRVTELEQQPADAAGELAEAREHNDRTCEAVAARDQAEAALDATYRERAHLVAHLAAIHPSHIGHTDPTAPDWAVVTVETPAGQMTWHIAERDMDLFTHVQPTNRICRGWDGHTTDEKYQRMRDLTQAAPSLLKLEVVADQQAAYIKQLTDRITTLEHVAAGNRQHVATIVPELEKAEAAIARVRALHAPADFHGRTICVDCSSYGNGSTDNVPAPYPCPTIRALDEQQPTT
ncbi:hypothetical protein ACIOHO_15630 [Streptomyces sp. NPDC087849]|uniref:WDGH domain-containing protein n=1 Tax=Streptomyces sp. NPDC087849 TaxID=3365808 RepID=UPI0038267B0D